MTQRDARAARDRGAARAGAALTGDVWHVVQAARSPRHVRCDVTCVTCGTPAAPKAACDERRMPGVRWRLCVCDALALRACASGAQPY